MAHIPELMAAGVPARLARMLGANRLRTITADGATQADATPLATNFCLIETPGAEAGVRLGYASGAAITMLYCLGPESALVYPAEDEAFNDQDPDQPLRLAAGNTLLAVPAVDHWLSVMSPGAGAVGEAPDGGPWGRQDGQWMAVPGEAPLDQMLYARGGAAWLPAPSWVNTVAELTLFTPTGNGQPVMVWGYWACGDDGGDPFVWDPGSLAAIDNGLVFAGPGGPGLAGRWRRALNRDATFAMFGARGDSDGTPGGGTDDTDAVRRALNSGQQKLRVSAGHRHRLCAPIVAYPPDGFDCELRFFYDLPNTGSTNAITFAGALGADIALVEHRAAQAWMLHLASLAGVAPGDWGKLWSTRWFDANRTQTLLGELIRVATPDALNPDATGPAGWVAMQTQLRDGYGPSRLATFQIGAGGAGYALGDLVNVVGGVVASGGPQQLRVVGVGGGGAATLLEWAGETSIYSTVPEGALATAAATGGGGGLTLANVTAEQAWFTPITPLRDLRITLDALCDPAQYMADGVTYFPQVALSVRYAVGGYIDSYTSGFSATAIELSHCVLTELDAHFTDEGLNATTGYGVAINGASRQSSVRVWAGLRQRHFAETGNYSQFDTPTAYAAGVARDNVVELMSATASAPAGGQPSYIATVSAVDTVSGAFTASGLSGIHHQNPVVLRTTGTLPAPFQLGYTYYGWVSGSQIYLYDDPIKSQQPGGPPPGAIVPTTLGSGAITVVATPGGDAFKTHAAAEGTVIRFGRLTGITGSGVTIESASAAIRGDYLGNCGDHGVVVVNYSSRPGRYAIHVGLIEHCGGNGLRVEAAAAPIEQVTARAQIRRATGQGAYFYGYAAPVRRIDIDLNIWDTQPIVSVTEAYFQNCAQLAGRVLYETTNAAAVGVRLQDALSADLRVLGMHPAGATGAGIYIDGSTPGGAGAILIEGCRIDCRGDGAALRGVELASANVVGVKIGDANDFAACGLPVALTSSAAQRVLNRYRTLQTASPASGATVAMTMSNPDLLLTPAATLASLTVQLPPAPGDGHIARVAATQAVTALALTAPDATVAVGATTLPAGGGLARRYVAAGNTWYPS